MSSEKKRENPIKLVRWGNGPPCAFHGTFEEVEKKVQKDERTKKGIKYVII